MQIKHPFIALAVKLCVFAIGSSLCQAGLIVGVQNASIAQGGSGFVDVFLTGDAGDTLGRFGYRFVISGGTPQAGDLQFEVSQSLGEQTLAAPHPYVFFGDTDPLLITSSRGNGGVDPISLVGGDSLATGDSVPVAGTFLLARLEIRHVGPFSPPSHNFTISLDANSPLTEFDQDWDPSTNNNYGLASLSSIAGTITVTAVPEPSAFHMSLFSLCMLYTIRRRRHKQV